MGGEIGVESEPGEGSRFWFKVPLTIDSGTAVECRFTAARAALGRGRRPLVRWLSLRWLWLGWLSGLWLGWLSGLWLGWLSLRRLWLGWLSLRLWHGLSLRLWLGCSHDCRPARGASHHYREVTGQLV